MEGTLTLLAAAKNRPTHLAVLLERGYDVNSASLTAAAALEDAFGCDTDHYGADYVPYHPFTARPESRLYVMRHDADPEATRTTFRPWSWRVPRRWRRLSSLDTGNVPGC